jgi:hypothetical protein
LNNLKALNAELEKDVERVRQRDRLLKKAELMKKKLPWLKYDMKKKEYKEAQEKEKTEKKKMEEVAKIWEDSKGPVEYVSCSTGFNFSFIYKLISRGIFELRGLGICSDVLRYEDFLSKPFNLNGYIHVQPRGQFY